MRIECKVWKDGKDWLAEVPAMDLMTQGTSRKNALEMIVDAIVGVQEKVKFKVKLMDTKDGVFVASDEVKEMIAFILFRQRTKKGLSLEEVRTRLKAKSRNTYAQYEQAKAEPTFSQIAKFCKALNCGFILIAA